jgi:lysophospholipase L1-like esterase
MRFLLAGDSTVAACPPEESPMSGWGAALAGRLRPEDEVLNFARGGATTASFVADGWWAALLAEATAGDTAVIQFGHNDQKHPGLLAAGGYRAGLQSFVADLRAVGVAPVLCTSVERRLFAGGRLRHSHGGYPGAVHAVAAELDTPLIDLTAFTSWLYEYLGQEGSAALFTAADDTHFHQDGADLVAGFVARSLRSILGWDAHLDPMGAPR